MPELFPTGLMRKEFDILIKCSKNASAFSIDELTDKTDLYFDKIKSAHKENPMVNVNLACAIVSSIHAIHADWRNIPEMAKPWCKGMIQYFIETADEDDDFLSPTGFDDDAAVLNACLKLADRADLCIDPEDYDEC
ncbi:hypothetical protein [Desulfamplus magnetovallimortis]|nr:hypothetical protein [Desulfamplus magnetovallimortis]